MSRGDKLWFCSMAMILLVCSWVLSTLGWPGHVAWAQEVAPPAVTSVVPHWHDSHTFAMAIGVAVFMLLEAVKPFLGKWSQSRFKDIAVVVLTALGVGAGRLLAGDTFELVGPLVLSQFFAAVGAWATQYPFTAAAKAKTAAQKVDAGSEKTK